ncbi:MAG TPA: GNAT family N-acetyltransferase [Gemmatimonadales bacterium]|nr:GNAT family N-acetyltransferase [Gemmatimonadales bacterium]
MKAEAGSVQLVTWRPELRTEFERLNREWIERYFTLEEEDRKVFEDPDGRIVQPGGQVFFVLEDEAVRGTCAVIRRDAETFELAKMAVEPRARGQGYGDRLVEAAVGFARAAGARRLILVSNTRLGPALNLYRKHGFREVPLDPGSGYSRADIQLERPLGP